jgi:hypothetical protein
MGSFARLQKRTGRLTFLTVGEGIGLGTMPEVYFQRHSTR